ncbi:MAG: CRISPR-associated endoribonuclease Cas6 [Limnochordia bacterium]|jgi:CRISPR-associated endoribonuclease Cas6|nr:CRISPR-associated endoribonuclease Cas6 [Limnochordia bacterium]
MQIKLTLRNEPSGLVWLPRANLHILQAFVYQLFSERLACFLHNEGFPFEKRTFKLFTFSWLSGVEPIKIIKDMVVLRSPLTLHISSPLLHILQDAATGALTKDSVRLGNNELYCAGVEVIDQKVTDDAIVIRALSPITCYSTLRKEDGKPYTVFYEPIEQEFQQQIDQNLRKKHSICWPTQPISEQRVVLEPVDKPRRQIAVFSRETKMPTKGWWGTFRVHGPRELLQVGVNAGFGSKNSSGWGCVEVLKSRE